MDYGFVVLVTGLIAIGGQKSQDWGDIRSGACCEPVYGAHNPLVDFGSSGEIQI